MAPLVSNHAKMDDGNKLEPPKFSAPTSELRTDQNRSKEALIKSHSEMASEAKQAMMRDKAVANGSPRPHGKADEGFAQPIPTPTGFVHPGCGGELLMAQGGLHIALKPSVRLYTPEGEFIEKIFTER
jgi:hypothetical protein